MSVDFTNQTVSVSSTPTANEHVATKGYVDSAVGAAGDATSANQDSMMGATFSGSTDSLEAIRDKIDTLPTSGGGGCYVSPAYYGGNSARDAPSCISGFTEEGTFNANTWNIHNFSATSRVCCK